MGLEIVFQKPRTKVKLLFGWEQISEYTDCKMRVLKENIHLKKKNKNVEVFHT